MIVGRFAPSPTGPLHVGNLRTALLAWLGARSVGGTMLLRVEDLDRHTSSPENERSQIDDLRRLGLEFPEHCIRQSERFALYEDAISDLSSRGLTYECWCSRREIREAASAPNERPVSDGAPELAYPGTCRDLSATQRRERQESGRRPALRLRADGEAITFHDLVRGETTGIVDDVVLRRNDGVPAYNLAVVIDDADQGVDQVVRGDDIASSTPRQIHLQRLLGLTTPTYAHVPLVVGGDGERLAKRHGAVTLADLAAIGVDAPGVRDELVRSLGVVATTNLEEAARRFEWPLVPRSRWTIPDHWQTGKP